MAELDVDLLLSYDDELSSEEFLSQYVAVEALIDDADEAGDANLLDIYEEKLIDLEHSNPNATRRLNTDRLRALDKRERRSRLIAAQVLLRNRKHP